MDGGGSKSFTGDGGSGGSIRLASPIISGTGFLTAHGGNGGFGFIGNDVFCDNGWRNNRGHGGAGSEGRIRLEGVSTSIHWNRGSRTTKIITLSGISFYHFTSGIGSN